MLDEVNHWNAHGVLRTLRDAEVASILFRYLGRVLLLDMRHDYAEGPLICVDGLAGGPQERVARLKRLRPRFPNPENITLAPWVGSVGSFDRRGGLAEVSDRLRRSGYPEAIETLQRAFSALLSLEREEALALIRGDVQRTKALYQRG